MSKMDELRALREARYEHTLARAAAHRADTSGAGATSPAAPGRTPRPPATPSTPAPPAGLESEQPGPPPVELPEAAEERLCGHRAISGRTCTREHGHAAKSHRYS